MMVTRGRRIYPELCWRQAGRIHSSAPDAQLFRIGHRAEVDCAGITVAAMSMKRSWKSPEEERRRECL